MMREKIIKNASYLFLGNVVVRLLTAAATIMLARHLGVVEFGMLSVSLALAAIAKYFTDMGLNHTLIREGTKISSDIPRLLGGALKIKLGLALVATLAFYCFIAFCYTDNVKLRNTAYFLVLPTIWGGALSGVGDIYFQIIQKMQYTALIRAVSGLIVAAVLLVGIFLDWTLSYLSLAYGIASVFGGLIGVWMVFKNVPGIGGWHWGLLEGLGCFTLGGFLILLLPQLGLIILERTTDMQQVGYFSAAFRIPNVLYSIPGVLATAFYPQLFRYGNNDSSRHFNLNVKEIKSMSLIGIALALPFALYPDKVVEILFGSSWVVHAGRPLMFLAWVVVLHSVNFPLADALTTQGMQRQRTVVLTLGVVLGAIFYGFLGKNWGATGGAIAALLIELILLVGFIVMNPKGGELKKIILLPMLSVAIAGALVGYAIKAILPFETLGLFLAPSLFICAVLLFDKEIRLITISFAKAKGETI